MSTADAAGWLNPDDADAYDNRGLALKEQGKETEAIADLRKSIGLTGDPDLCQWAEVALSELGVQ